MPVSHRDDADPILRKCLLLDLETLPNGKLLKIGAVCGAQERLLQGKFAEAEAQEVLDTLSREASYVLGHNIRDHDLPILRKEYPTLHLHELPVIDTLFLSPIAFPEHPYHHLVKNDKLQRTALNDPICDAKGAGNLFVDQHEVFRERLEKEENLVRFYAWALSDHLAPFFQELGAEPLSGQAAETYFIESVSRLGCKTASRAVAVEALHPDQKEASAYAYAWLRIAGSNSIVPPWVRHRFPAVSKLVWRLRDQGCSDASCSYCQLQHNPEKQLKQFFGFDDFRAQPEGPEGESLQEEIVRTGMNGKPLLAILPTGGGKSLCYQLPALVKNQRLGGLSIVISPLQALMKDQVDNLNRLTGSRFAAAVYGMLTRPERGDVLDRIRMGEVALLYVSPEQLRNRSFRSVIKEREITCWIFDEAHCIARWGQSFRPDYLYASRFIKELAEEQGTPPPPVACFTATAKKDVEEEIRQHFQEELSQDLEVFNGGAERVNLDFEVQVVSSADKKKRVLRILKDRLPQPDQGSSVVYCATRKKTEEMAESLKLADLSAEAFHAGLEAPEKRKIQERFIGGELQHICATNAFGMGIDKEDVRIVIHAEVPGSLENYLQEAGRAGRDRRQAQCVLLYDKQDVETQFSLSAFSRLTRRDIAEILRGLRRAKRDTNDAVVITPGEILRDEKVETTFDSTDSMAPTKIHTAVSMLDRGDFVRRDENRTSMLQVSPVVRSLEEGEEKLSSLKLSRNTRRQWLDILEAIFQSDPNQGISADELAELPSMYFAPTVKESQVLRHDTLPVMRILKDMVEAQIIKKDTLMTAYVIVGGGRDAAKTMAQMCQIEEAMLKIMREAEPDAEGWLHLGLRQLRARLKEEGHNTTPDTLISLLKGLSFDGRGISGDLGSIDLKYRDKGHYRVKLQKPWEKLVQIAERKRTVAGNILQTILAKIPSGLKGENLAEFSEQDLRKGLKGDMLIAAKIKDYSSAIERGLLFLHEQKVIILQQGLAVFRQAMTIKVLPGDKKRARPFTKGDYSPLEEHYKERNFQIHVMNQYAELGLEKIQGALGMVTAYFTMSKTEFVQKYFAGRQDMLERATSAESYQTIVDRLNNPVQVAVVAGPPASNMLVLAGPGSGKTRVIAHRCAFLLRVARVRPREVLVVCFNRSAAISLRQRIKDLVGRDAVGVTVQTYHGLAMRLIGTTFAGLEGKGGTGGLDALIPEATKMLKGEYDIPGLERDEVRERLLSGYRYILIDEYQDIDEPQYDLVSAIAGRALESKNEDAKLSILAVGDDDQNIYSFRGANVKFIKRFEEDYGAQRHYLVENYRSTSNIIEASNELIALNKDRMKTEHPIRINAGRRTEGPGDPVAIACCQDALHQARYVLSQTKALGEKGGSVAIFARTKRELHTIRGALEHAEIPSVLGAETKGNVPLHRMREPLALIARIKELELKTTTAGRLQKEFQGLGCYNKTNPWCQIVDSILSEWRAETNNNSHSPDTVIDFIYEALHERQRDRVLHDGVYLSTVHAAKGLEFDHVIVLGSWTQSGAGAEHEEERRLYYVGMTRARKTLTLCSIKDSANPHLRALTGPSVKRFAVEEMSEPLLEAINLSYELIDCGKIWPAYPACSPRVRSGIARLDPGNRVKIEQRDSENRIFVRDLSGRKVGALSAAASEEWNSRLQSIREVRVHSVVKWKRDTVDEGAIERCPDEWEVPLLEVVSTGELNSG